MKNKVSWEGVYQVVAVLANRLAHLHIGCRLHGLLVYVIMARIAIDIWFMHDHTFIE